MTDRVKAHREDLVWMVAPSVVDDGPPIGGEPRVGDGGTLERDPVELGHGPFRDPLAQIEERRAEPNDRDDARRHPDTPVPASSVGRFALRPSLLQAPQPFGQIQRISEPSLRPALDAGADVVLEQIIRDIPLPPWREGPLEIAHDDLIEHDPERVDVRERRGGPALQ